MNAIRCAVLLFPLAVSAGEFKRLYAESATASSFLKSNWNKYEENYHPSYALDDDPKTAWVEGAEGLGDGETWTVELSPLKKAKTLRLVVFNGYQKSKVLLEANGAPKTVTVTVKGPGARASGKQTLELKKALGAQSFDIPLTAGLASVTLQLVAEHPGAKYQDTCLSDLQFFVDSDEPYSAGVEKGKLEALKRWKTDRLGTAKYYASLPKQWPYAATRFNGPAEWTVVKKIPRYSKIEGEETGFGKGVPAPGYKSLEDRLKKGENFEVLAESQRALVEKLLPLTGKPPQGKWFSFASKTATKPPEGFPLHESLEALMHPGDATLFEATGIGKTSVAIKFKPMEDFAEGTQLSNALLLEGTPTDPKLFYVRWTHEVSERSSSTEVRHMLVSAEGGKLKSLVTWRIDDDPFSSLHGVEVITPTWNAEGKVAAFDLVNVYETEPIDSGASMDDGIHVEKKQLTAAPST